MYKNYLVVDIYGDYKELMNYKGLKQLLLEELVRDTKDNYQEYDIVSINADIFKKLALEELISTDYLIEQLEGYGFKVIELLELQRDLEDIKELYLRNNKYIRDFDNVLEIINNGINKGVKDNV